jgi:hypothetical protein
MTRLWVSLLFFMALPSFGGLVAPAGFSVQTLDITKGSALKPDGWFYSQHHRARKYLRWVISKEDAEKANGAYETGVAINLMLGFTEKTGMNSEQLAKDLISQITSYGEIIRQCEPEKIGDMFRVCVEKIEENESGNTYHVMYTFMWWPSAEMVAYTSAGTKPEMWSTYSKTFDTMSVIEVVGGLGERETHNKSIQPTAKAAAD